ncbi:ABC transporter substrate-binding protein [uncultured Enterovirga sp.]|uniref:ABC transporter substrate-binding protein n=1 Tax=uncultured Enterovirga sp. TaxID=2026352 RepID=UPI0035CC8B3E
MPTRRSFLAASGGALAAAAGGASAQSTEPFRIACLTPLTGAGSTFGPGIAKAVAAAVESINQQGGAAGRRFELFSEDDQTQPQAGVLAAKKLIEVNKVRAIVGGWSSSVSMSIMPLTNDADVIFSHVSTAPELSDPRNNKKSLGFRFQSPASVYGTTYAEVCAREDFKRVAVMAFNNGSAVGIADAFEKAWAARGNKIVERVIYEPNQTSYRAELQKVLAARPDCIATGSYLTDTTIIMKDWFQSGATNKWLAPSWAINSDLVKAIGNEPSEGLLSITTVANETAPAWRTFDEMYRRVMGVPGETNKDAAMNWDAINVIALALEAGKGADGADLARNIKLVTGPEGTKVGSFAEGRDLLRRGERINYEGASSAVDFDDRNDVVSGYALQAVEKGRFVRKYLVGRPA